MSAFIHGQYSTEDDAGSVGGRQQSWHLVGSEQPGSPAKWASLADWETHRDIISKLYFTLTLRKLMKVMERDYGFIATVKMYKHRIHAWRLHKNMSFERLRQIMERQAVGDNCDTSRDAKWEASVVDLYISRLPRQRRMELAEIQCRAQSSCTFPLQASVSGENDLHRAERCLYHLQASIHDIFERELVSRKTIPNWSVTQFCVGVYHMSIVTKTALRYGLTAQAFKIIQPYFDHYQELLYSYDPRLFPMTIGLSSIVAAAGPEIGASMISYAKSMAETTYGRNHPFCTALGVAATVGFPQCLPTFVGLMLASYQIVCNELPPGDSYRDHIAGQLDVLKIVTSRVELGGHPFGSEHYQTSARIAKMIAGLDRPDITLKLSKPVTEELVWEDVGDLLMLREHEPIAVLDNSDNDTSEQIWNNNTPNKKSRLDCLSRLARLADFEMSLMLSPQAGEARQARKAFTRLIDTCCELPVEYPYPIIRI